MNKLFEVLLAERLPTSSVKLL